MALVNLSVRLPKELMDAVDLESFRQDRPRGWVIRKVLEEKFGKPVKGKAPSKKKAA